MALVEKYVSSAGGGAHDGSTEANAYSWAEMVTAINVPATAGTRFNVKGTISRTTTADGLTGDGTATSPIIIRGYGTAIGDGYLGRTSSNAALITTNMPAISYTTGRLDGSGSNWIIYESLNITSAASAPTLQTLSDCAIVRCTITNSSTNAAATGITSGVRPVIFDNDVTLSGASGALVAISVGQNGRCLGNRVKGGPGIGIRASATGNTAIIDNLVYASAGVGILTLDTAGISTIYGNTVVGGTGDGIDIVTGSTALQCIINNMITDNGGYGIDGVSAANAIFAACNRTRDNTSGADNLATDWLAATKYSHVTTDTGGAETDYTAAGSQDYTLISGSPAKGVGHFNFRDLGALQRQESGGSGGVSKMAGDGGGFAG